METGGGFVWGGGIVILEHLQCCVTAGAINSRKLLKMEVYAGALKRREDTDFMWGTHKGEDTAE